MATQQLKQERPPTTELRAESGAAQRNGRPGDGDGRQGDEQLAKALGWFSIGLGLAQLAAPGEVARFIGVHNDGDTRKVLRGVGLRELTSGLGILTQPRPAGWLWARVGGDVMDISLLTGALTSDRSERDKVSAAMAAVLGITALDVLCARQLSAAPQAQQGLGGGHGLDVQRTVTIGRPAEELYRFWRNFENLPRFMSHLEAVRVVDERRSHWKARAPLGASVEWDAEIVEDRPNELIAWRSVAGADVDNAGVVRFAPAPAGRGTEVHVQLRYSPPAGVLGAAVAKLFGEEPGQQVIHDLRAFKQVVEAGEVVRSDASIHRRPHPARPPSDKV